MLAHPSARHHQLAPRRKRRIAKLIDLLSIIGAALLGNLIQRVVLRDPARNVLVLPVTFLLLWCVQSYFLLGNGQTIGKKALGIRIVSAETESQPHWLSLLLLREPLSLVISLIPVIGQIYRIADVLFMFREDQRCLHDHIAGTKVVTDYATYDE